MSEKDVIWVEPIYRKSKKFFRIDVDIDSLSKDEDVKFIFVTLDPETGKFTLIKCGFPMFEMKETEVLDLHEFAIDSLLDDDIEEREKLD